MANTLKRIAGPAYLGSSVANIYTPPAATIFTKIKHIHVANVTASVITFTLYVGATGGSTGGTEIAKNISLAPNGVFDYYSDGMFMASTDFLTGIASAATSATILVEGEQGVV